MCVCVGMCARVNLDIYNHYTHTDARTGLSRSLISAIKSQGLSACSSVSLRRCPYKEGLAGKVAGAGSDVASLWKGLEAGGGGVRTTTGGDSKGWIV